MLSTRRRVQIHKPCLLHWVAPLRQDALKPIGEAPCFNLPKMSNVGIASPIDVGWAEYLPHGLEEFVWLLWEAELHHTFFFAHPYNVKARSVLGQKDMAVEDPVLDLVLAIGSQLLQQKLQCGPVFLKHQACRVLKDEAFGSLFPYVFNPIHYQGTSLPFKACAWTCWRIISAWKSIRVHICFWKVIYAPGSHIMVDLWQARMVQLEEVAHVRTLLTAKVDNCPALEAHHFQRHLLCFQPSAVRADMYRICIPSLAGIDNGAVITSVSLQTH